jgi:hypothetical protein
MPRAREAIATTDVWLLTSCKFELVLTEFDYAARRFLPGVSPGFIFVGDGEAEVELEDSLEESSALTSLRTSAGLASKAFSRESKPTRIAMRMMVLLASPNRCDKASMR